MKRAAITLAFAAMLLSLLPSTRIEGASIPSIPLEQPVRQTYSIDVALDFSTGSLAAHEAVHVTNIWDEPLQALVFNVTAARKGALTIDRVQVAGQDVATALDGVVLSVQLDAPLPPGSTTAVDLDFRAQIPSPGDLRFGRSNGVLALGNWYPVLGVYRPGQGWDRHRYVATGDAFVTEVADYDVTITISGGDGTLALASAGTVVSHDGNVWHLRSSNVRDFALAVSNRYVSSTADVDGTRINVYYLPEHAAGGAIYLRAAVESFRWYNRTLGQYPYPQLTIAETTGNDPGWVGQEYPTIIMIGSSSTASPGGMGDYLTYAVAHEVAHQWFYGLVGNDQVYEPWLDEAFASYLGAQFLRMNYPQGYAVRWGMFKDRFNSELAANGWRPVDSSIYDYRSESHYYAMVYGQGALFLDDLRQAMGDDRFWQLLRDFVARYQYKLASGHSFLALGAQHSGADLTALYARYFLPSLFASNLDYDVPNGHFYSQANGQPGGTAAIGYSVTNAGNVRFWDEFRRLGGVAGVGYPASRRFMWDGFVSQVFQKGVFQWRPDAGVVYLVNVFDQLSTQGKDDWLRTVRATPGIADWSDDSGRSWPDVVGRHQQLLDANQSIKDRYFAVADPVTIYGLPMSPIADAGEAWVLRAQRAIIQQWKVDVPWARAGQVTVANGGDIAKEAGLIPVPAAAPEPAP